MFAVFVLVQAFPGGETADPCLYFDGRVRQSRRVDDGTTAVVRDRRLRKVYITSLRLRRRRRFRHVVAVAVAVVRQRLATAADRGRGRRVRRQQLFGRDAGDRHHGFLVVVRPTLAVVRGGGGRGRRRVLQRLPDPVPAETRLYLRGGRVHRLHVLAGPETAVHGLYRSGRAIVGPAVVRRRRGRRTRDGFLGDRRRPAADGRRPVRDRRLHRAAVVVSACNRKEGRKYFGGKNRNGNTNALYRVVRKLIVLC